jgi:hypothetical protein
MYHDPLAPEWWASFLVTTEYLVHILPSSHLPMIQNMLDTWHMVFSRQSVHCEPRALVNYLVWWQLGSIYIVFYCIKFWNSNPIIFFSFHKQMWKKINPGL